MPDINGQGDIKIPFCMYGDGQVYAVRCLAVDQPLLLEMKPGIGSVRSKRMGSIKAKLSLTAIREPNTGFVKPVHRGSGNINIVLYPQIRGDGCVKSFISGHTSRQAVELVQGDNSASILTPIYNTKDLRILFSHWSSFLPEVGQPVMSHCTMEKLNKQEHIDIEVMKESLGSDEFRGDRRNWMVARVRFKCKPVMYLLNMGWPGVYNPMKFVLDTHAYQHLIHYIFTMVTPDIGGESTYRYSLDGTVLDRVRRLQVEPLPDISRLPQAIKELINLYGDYDPLIRERVYGVNQ